MTQDHRRAARLYNKRRKTAIAAGTWLHQVPAAEPLKHLTMLRDAGMSVAAMAADSGIPAGTLRNILSGRVRFLHGPTAAGIRAIKYRPTPPAGFVPAVGSQRRAQALCAVGHPASDLSARLGRNSGYLWELLNGKERWVSRATAEKIAALYAELSMTPGPSERARSTARRNGWALPLAWDEGRIDDPAASPARMRKNPPKKCRYCPALIWLRRTDADPALIERILDGRAPILTTPIPVRVAVVRQLAALGYDDATIAARTRWPALDGTEPWKGVAKLRGRHGIPAARPGPVAA